LHIKPGMLASVLGEGEVFSRPAEATVRKSASFHIQ